MNLITSLFCFIVPSSSYLLMPVKRKLFFFPASLKNPLPQELYRDFLDDLNQTYDVEVVTSSNDLENTTDEFLFMSHSSGAMNMMDVYRNTPEGVPKKAVLIDPLDYKKFNQSPKMFSFDLMALDTYLKNIFEMDVWDVLSSSFSNNIESEKENKDEIMIIHHKSSATWRYVPLIPPINFLKMNTDDLKNVTIQEKVLNDHSHFDILDKPWANQINKFSFQEKTKENRAYADEVLPIINEFYNN